MAGSHADHNLLYSLSLLVLVGDSADMKSVKDSLALAAPKRGRKVPQLPVRTPSPAQHAEDDSYDSEDDDIEESSTPEFQLSFGKNGAVSTAGNLAMTPTCFPLCAIRVHGNSLD